METTKSAGAGAMLMAESDQHDFVPSCSWQQILRILEENALSSRHSFSTTKQLYPRISDVSEVGRINL
jgi:hypothetical protein